MQTTVIVSRQGAGTRNQETGQIEYAWTTIYEGPARIRFTNNQPRDFDSSGQGITEQAPTVSFPIAASGLVTVDDVGEVIANPSDPAIVGMTFRIAGTHQQTHSTARRFPVEVVSHG